MCLSCIKDNKNIVHKGKIAEVFNLSTKVGFNELTLADFKDIPGSLTGNYLHTHRNMTIQLTDKQIKEVIEEALAIVVTGVDTRIDVWSIQWPNDYKPQNF